jgi:hypothetical protein
MAYAQSAVTVTNDIINGVKWWHIKFTETEVGVASQWAVLASDTHLPRCGTITLIKVSATYTTATTVQPAVGRTTGWTANTSAHFGQVSAAAAFINDASGLRFDFGNNPRTLYGRTTPNAGSDTSTTVELTIVEGHI